MAPSTAVLLMAYGSPNTLDEVEPYYRDIRGGRTPTKEQVEELTERYRRVGGRTPLLEITREVAAVLERRLGGAGGGPYKVYVGMKHWHPYIAEAVDQMAGDGVERGSQRRLAPRDLRPGRIEQVIAEPVEAGLQRADPGGAVAEIVQALRVADEEVEAMIAVGPPAYVFQVGPGVLLRGQVVGHERAARGSVRERDAGFPVVGQRSQTTGAGDAQPGASPLEVAPGQHVPRVGPVGSGCGRARVKLIPVGGQHEPVAGMLLVRKDDETHLFLVWMFERMDV